MNNYLDLQSNKDTNMAQKIVNGLHIELTPLTEKFLSFIPLDPDLAGINDQM